MAEQEKKFPDPDLRCECDSEVHIPLGSYLGNQALALANNNGACPRTAMKSLYHAMALIAFDTYGAAGAMAAILSIQAEKGPTHSAPRSIS